MMRSRESTTTASHTGIGAGEPGPPGQRHEGRGQEQLVRHGIEHRPQGRLLVADAGDQAVEEVRDPRHHEDREGPLEPARQHQHHERRDQGHAEEGELIGNGKDGFGHAGTDPLWARRTKEMGRPRGQPRRATSGARSAYSKRSFWVTSFATKSLQAFSWASPMPLLRHSSAFVPTPKPPLSKLKPPPLFEMPSPLTEATISPEVTSMTRAVRFTWALPLDPPTPMPLIARCPARFSVENA